MLKTPSFASLRLSVFALKSAKYGNLGVGHPLRQIAAPLAEQSAEMTHFSANFANK